MVKLWHVSSRTCVRTMKEDRQTMIASFNPSGSKFITGGAGPGIYMYDTQTWDNLGIFQSRRLSGPHICGDAVSIDKTGTQILTGSWRRNNCLQIWDAESGNKIMDIPDDFRGQSQIYTCHFLGNDHIVAGGSRSNLCRLIDRRILMSTGILNDLPGGVYSTHSSVRGVLGVTTTTIIYLTQSPVRP
uniref:Uncharacterized protein n=1 Tax=Sphaerodactylus townsendi TaxID=933632 RepID=A0ACB8EVG8_9SAUR